MTAQAETRFTCDRCRHEVNVVLQNTPHRVLPPGDWVMAVMTTDSELVTLHLCPSCRAGWQAFLAAPQPTAPQPKEANDGP